MAIKIYTADNPVKAYLVKGFFKAEGVSAFVLDEHFGDYPSVWIQEDIQAEIAHHVVMGFENANTDDETFADSWCCSICDEKIEHTFTVCWQCGSIRSDLILDNR
jgi:Putative prokaryotic signal transducing protein